MTTIWRPIKTLQHGMYPGPIRYDAIEHFDRDSETDKKTRSKEDKLPRKSKAGWK